jgi:hypothetical protein
MNKTRRIAKPICKMCDQPARGRMAVYCSTECFLDYERAYSRQHHAKFTPERKRASSLVNTAIYSGKLKRQPCEVCGAGATWTQAHHDDYAKPLDVRWLCRSCHKRHHVKFGPGKNSYAT